MKRWSKLQKRLYELVDESIDFKLHCTVYRMQSRCGSTDLPRYFITLAGEIIFDYPKDFVLKSGGVKSLAQGALTKIYPYGNDISDIGELIREYIDTPKDELFKKHFDADEWGLANILKAADKRIGKRRLQILAKNKKNQAMQKVIAARLEALQ
ncbi:SF0329 family protein [Campylobacter rectus]